MPSFWRTRRSGCMVHSCPHCLRPTFYPSLSPADAHVWWHFIISVRGVCYLSILLKRLLSVSWQPTFACCDNKAVSMAGIFFSPSVSQENGSSHLFFPMSLAVRLHWQIQFPCIKPVPYFLAVLRTLPGGGGYMFIIKQPDTLQVTVPEKQIRAACVAEVPTN